MSELKIAGMVLVILSSSYVGFYFANLTQKRMNALLEMQRALGILKAEITYGLTVFPEAAYNIAMRTESPAREIFLDMHTALSVHESNTNTESLYDIWQDAFHRAGPKSHFEKEDLQTFQGLGKTMGYLDKHMQAGAIALADAYIIEKVDKLGQKNEKTARMYRSIGILTGLLIAVVLL